MSPHSQLLFLHVCIWEAQIRYVHTVDLTSGTRNVYVDMAVQLPQSTIDVVEEEASFYLRTVNHLHLCLPFLRGKTPHCMSLYSICFLAVGNYFRFGTAYNI